VNAFNTVRRSSIFSYLLAHARIYGSMFPFFNLMYGESSKALAFAFSVAQFAVEITGGTRQGCVSGPLSHALGTMEPSLKYVGKLAQASDDVYILVDALSIAPSVFADFAAVGQVLSGPKLRILTPAYIRDLPPLLAHAQQVSEPTFVLGGLVSPVLMASCADVVRQWVDKRRSRLNALLALPTSRQNKYLILTSMMWDLVYFAETFLVASRDEIFGAIDEMHYSCLQRIVGAPVPHVPSFRPIEDGGLGLLPYADLHPYLLERSMANSVEYVAKFGLVVPPPLASAPSVSYVWRSKFRTGSFGLRNSSLSLSHLTFLHSSDFVSWLHAWPTNKYAQLDDDAFEFGVRFRCSMLKPAAYPCPALGANLITLSPSDYTTHMVQCVHCGHPNFWIRHEKVVAAIKATNRFYGICSRIPASGEYPLPGNVRGGPDLMVDTDRTWAVDVTVAKDALGYESTARLVTRYTEKLRKYKQFSQETTFETVPFVMSVYGIIERRTLDVIECWRMWSNAGRTYSRDLFVNCQMELLRGLRSGILQLHARATIGFPASFPVVPVVNSAPPCNELPAQNTVVGDVVDALRPSIDREQ
jgi:hypothetical protein